MGNKHKKKQKPDPQNCPRTSLRAITSFFQPQPDEERPDSTKPCHLPQGPAPLQPATSAPARINTPAQCDSSAALPAMSETKTAATGHGVETPHTTPSGAASTISPRHEHSPTPESFSVSAESLKSAGSAFHITLPPGQRQLPCGTVATQPTQAPGEYPPVSDYPIEAIAGEHSPRPPMPPKEPGSSQPPSHHSTTSPPQFVNPSTTLSSQVRCSHPASPLDHTALHQTDSGSSASSGGSTGEDSPPEYWGASPPPC
ncbi:uncharacterized protein LOC130309127 [Hyla sarda]|uniref:uncharacterized protein LOC130309127 n=1 Tax=Hyla sarda TaxID=327740 RepID=UPI0024C2653C|nr:uncharacterized protein LOC130309127 [Hyla sarda]